MPKHYGIYNFGRESLLFHHLGIYKIKAQFLFLDQHVRRAVD